MAQDLNGGLNSVQTRQTDIHHHQIRTRLLAELHRLGAAARLADHAEFGATLQNGTEAVPHHFVIVDQQNIVCHTYLNRSGRPLPQVRGLVTRARGSIALDRQIARTTVTLSGALSICNSMPARSAKCCITRSSNPTPRNALSAASNPGPLSRISSVGPFRIDFSSISMTEQPARRTARQAASSAIRYKAAAASGAGCAAASAKTRTLPLKSARRRPARLSNAARNPIRSATAGFNSRWTSRTSPMTVSSMA